MNNFIICVKGVSGSGKSTRTYMLLKYFKEILGYTLEDFIYLNKELKNKVVGILVKEINLVVLGKFYETGGVERFQGVDVMTGYFIKSEYMSEFLRDNSDKYSFLIEGAGTTQSNRLRPKFLKEFCGFDNILMQYYNYAGDKQSYDDRIIYRSGKLPNKGTMWDKDQSFTKEVTFSLNEKELYPESLIIINDKQFNYPIWDLGVDYFTYFGDESQIDIFKYFCEELDYVNINTFKNFEK